MRRQFLLASVLTIFLCPSSPAFGQQSILAATPPLGWNSWDAYGLTITEPQFRANVDVLAKKLAPFGWDDAVIDEGWFLKNPEDRPTPEKLQYQLDAYGRYIPVPARFPSSEGNGSFQNLGDYVHSLGLKFGIHIVRGIPRESVARNLPVEGSTFKASDAADTSDACPWDPTNWGIQDTPAGQAWYDSLLRQYAGWGVDYLKVDCIADHPYKVTEIRMLHRAIEKTGRPIVLSLSPGPTQLEHAVEVGTLAQMWRISDDIWDFWTNPKPWPQTVRSQFDRLAAWQPYAKPGNWPDADMLPIGHLGPKPDVGKSRDTNLTHDEQRTLMTLWAIARSPLILGANLTELDEWTTKLITNKDVIAVNQQGHGQRQSDSYGQFIVWSSEGAPGVRYFAVFNLGDEPSLFSRPLIALDARSTSPGFTARDLWTGKSVGNIYAFTATIPPHGCVLLELTQVPFK
jgi:alpha-galactosidase